jgi:hypothetical protein
MRRLVCALALTMTVGLAGTVEATQTLFTDFEGFKTGASIDRQNGWGRTGPYDEQVVNVGGNTVWRVSNAVTSGSFGDQPFAPRLGGIPANTVTNPTNDSPGAFAGESSTGTSLKVFQAKFSFRSATGAPQPGARITVSADNGQGGRQSFIVIADAGAGLEVSTFDVDSSGNFIGAAGCNLDIPPCPPLVIASGLSYTTWHTTSVEIRFKDGPNNDVVRYFVNGKRVHTSGSWEQFYRSDPGQFAIHPLGVPVQTLLFRISSTAHPELLGRGFYIDNLSMSVSRSGEKGGDDEDDRGHEEHHSYRVALGAGEENQYVLASGLDAIALTAVLAEGQGLAMDIINPLGAVIASSLPSVGGTSLAVPTVPTGDYTMRVRNVGLTDVSTTLTLIRSLTP